MVVVLLMATMFVANGLYLARFAPGSSCNAADNAGHVAADSDVTTIAVADAGIYADAVAADAAITDAWFHYC